MRYLSLFAKSSTARRPSRARRAPHGTHRRARLEPLEERTLLSLAPSDYGPEAYALAVADERVGGVQAGFEAAIELEDSLGATTQGQEWLLEQIRIAVWTPEPIADLGDWVESQTWPDGIYVDRYTVKELSHMPLSEDPRGGYRTVLEIDPVTTLSADAALGALEALDFVDFAKLASEYPDETPEETPGGPTEPRQWLREKIRIGVWTPEQIADVGDWVESQTWPDGMEVERYLVKELIHMRLLQDPRGGYRTILEFDPITTLSADAALAALEALDFVDYAKLASQSLFRYTPRLQELIDNTTMDGSDESGIVLPGWREDELVLMVEETLRASTGDQEWLREPVRIGVWTPEQIADVGDWVESQTWPDGIYVDGYLVNEMIHKRLLVDPRGGYRTILEIRPITTLSADAAVAALKDLDFVDFAKLASQSAFRYSARTQELFDAITMGGSDAPVYLPVEQSAPARPVEVLVGIWTEGPMTDVRAFVDANQWPVALGDIDVQAVERLVSKRLWSDPRGGYRTVIRMPMWGDFTSLDQADFVDFAVLDVERHFQYSPELQDSLDRLTIDGSTEPVYLALAESTPLVSMDDFREDVRFSGYDGSGYAAAILDTGIDLDHPFFGEDADQNGVADRIVYQYDFADGDADASDQNGHGTHVASIVASEDETYTGMAPAADIIPLKVFTDQGSGEWAYVESALQWVVDNYDVYNIVSVNMSLSDGGNYQTPQTLYGVADQIESLARAGVIVVSASGNAFYSYASAQGVGYPAADPNSLSIGAVYDDDIGYVSYASGAIAYTTDADRVAPFSQRDDELTTVMAPGAAITAAWLNGGTNTLHGTSMAAPHVAGMAVVAQHLAAEELGQQLTQQQFVTLLQETGTTVNDGDDEDDNVDNTDLDFPRADMFALAEAILDLHWQFDAGDEADDASPDTFVLSRVADSIQVQVNAQDPTVIALEDVVRITLTGSTDQDTFTVNSLGDFTGNVVIHAAGEGDVVRLYDSPGSDTLTAYPGSATFVMENAYRIAADGHGSLYAYSQNGGDDTAVLRDDPAGDDTFYASPTLAKLYGEGFFNQASSFAEVFAYSGADHGVDVAALYDDPAGDDTFQAWPTLAKLYGDGFFNQASSFAEVHAYSGVDHGFDVASLYDDPTGDDTFRAWPTEAKLYGNGFFNRAKSFAQVHAYSGVDHGFDVASLYDDPAGDDTFKAWPQEAKLYGDGFYNRAKSFAQVHALSGVDHGFDVASLYDDATGDDTFRAWPTDARLYGNGFYNRAKSFAQVHAFSGVDHGEDLAQLYDGAGNDTFRAWPTEARLYGNGFYNRAKSFRTVYGYAEQGSGGTDVGYLYDSTGDDYLQARDGDPAGEDWIMLRDAADAVYAIWAYGLDEIWADSGTGDDDTADVGAGLDFLLHLTGVWENQL